MSTLHRMTAISAIAIWAQTQSKLKRNCADSAQQAPCPRYRILLLCEHRPNAVSAAAFSGKNAFFLKRDRHSF